MADAVQDRPPERLIERLRQALGESAVLTADTPGADLSAWELDWRKRYRGRALAVVRPASTDEVALTVRLCTEHAVPIVPQGGNTGLVGGGVPDTSGSQVVLSLARLNRVRQIDTANATMCVEAGCVLQAAQEAADAAGLLLPLSLAAEGSCTIGGNLATNAGGTQVLRHGNARDLCLGLEVVTARGEVWDGLSGLRKDNTGYDLRHLLIGSEGTLGIITAAVLKLVPPPAATLTAWASVDHLDDAVRLLAHAQRLLGAGLTGFEVMNAMSVALVARHFSALTAGLPGLRAPGGTPPAWSVLIELSDPESESHASARLEAVLGDALEGGWVQDALVASSIAQARTLWHVRESVPLAQSEEGLNIKHDISLPISRIAAFVPATDTAIQHVAPGARMIVFGHLGDGNLHYNVQAPLGTEPAAFLRELEPAINRVVYDAVTAAGGSISAEHGIGALKREELEARKSPVALGMMRGIKQALDPQGLLNPGRVLRADGRP
jgi:FAD/FMN-containing dehydrogenase